MTFTYVYLIKPRLAASGSDGSRLMMLNLCARSRYIVPIIMVTSLWLINTQMQLEAFFQLTIGANVRLYFRSLFLPPRPIVNESDYEDSIYDYRTDDDGDTYTSDSNSDHSSVSIIEFPLN